MTLLVPTTSGGWKALAVVAHNAAAAAAFVGDLTMVSLGVTEAIALSMRWANLSPW